MMSERSSSVKRMRRRVKCDNEMRRMQLRSTAPTKSNGYERLTDLRNVSIHQTIAVSTVASDRQLSDERRTWWLGALEQTPADAKPLIDRHRSVHASKHTSLHLILAYSLGRSHEIAVSPAYDAQCVCIKVYREF